jgi:glycosyltransferase involved in cell wall biosynthesis
MKLEGRKGSFPAVIVVGPPWLETGTGRVIENQIRYYNDRGFLTAYVAVPVNASHIESNSIWRDFSEAAKHLEATHTSCAILRSVPRPKFPWPWTYRKRRGLTALDWIVSVASVSEPPPALFEFVRECIPVLIHVNHVFTLGFAKCVQAKLSVAGYSAIPIILETHDVQADVLHQRSEVNPWTRCVDSLDDLRQAERAMLRDCSVFLHCSVDDCAYFESQFPERRHVLALPQIRADFISAVQVHRQSATDPIDVLFVGAAHSANAQAVTWLLEEVWPLIQDRGWTLKIVGNVSELIRWCSPAILKRFSACFTGHVKDLAPYYGAARCVVGPMRSGTGISIKTIEAFALGLPFIGTKKAYRGLPKQSLEAAGVRYYDAPKEFAVAISEVIAGEGCSGLNGRLIYEQLFNREPSYAARDEAVRCAFSCQMPAATRGTPTESARNGPLNRTA